MGRTRGPSEEAGLRLCVCQAEELSLWCLLGVRVASEVGGGTLFPAPGPVPVRAVNQLIRSS